VPFHLKRAQLRGRLAWADKQPVDTLVAPDSLYPFAQGHVQTWKSFFGQPGDSATHYQCGASDNRGIGGDQKEVCGPVRRLHVANSEPGHEVAS
jgi:hypothetical protein